LEANVAPGEAHNVGLWHSDGEFDLYLSSAGGDSSFIPPKNFDQQIRSKTIALDSFIKSNVKLLKLEAEGSEPEVLQGLGKALSRVEYITADLGPERGENQETTVVSVTNFLLQQNFELVSMSHSRICALYRNKSFQSEPTLESVSPGQ
jgi:hypothetical protein